MNNMKMIREKRCLTQDQVATKLNIDRSSIAKWETGESSPRADKLPKLAGLYECTIDELLADKVRGDLHDATT